MAQSFSDRIGKTKPKSILQIDSIDTDLRNGLWQACIEHCLKAFTRHSEDEIFKVIMRSIYIDFFKKPSDTIPYGHADGIGEMRRWFHSAPWWEVYNFVEFLFPYGGKQYAERVSFFLERERSGYRIIGDQLAPITDPLEIDAISEAVSIPDTFSGA